MSTTAALLDPTPAKEQQSRVDAACATGWRDRDIFDAVLQAAANRAFNQVLKTFNIETQDAFV